VQRAERARDLAGDRRDVLVEVGAQPPQVADQCPALGRDRLDLQGDVARPPSSASI
jgi:hypothetical protein